MSEDFGKSVRFPPPPQLTPKDVRAMYPDHAHLDNAQYNRLFKDYLLCVSKYMQDFYSAEQLE